MLSAITTPLQDTANVRFAAELIHAGARPSPSSSLHFQVVTVELILEVLRVTALTTHFLEAFDPSGLSTYNGPPRPA